jgi:hypothetical protein
VLPDRLARSQALQDVDKRKIILKDKQEAFDVCSKNKKAPEEQKEVTSTIITSVTCWLRNTQIAT